MVALTSPKIPGQVSSGEGLQFCLLWRKRRVFVPYDLWVSRIGPTPYHATASCLQVSLTHGALSSQQSSSSSRTSPIPSTPSWRASSVSRASPLPPTLFSPLNSPWTVTDFSYTLVKGSWRSGRPPHPHDSMGPGFKSLCCHWVTAWARHAPSHLWASDSSLVKWRQGTLICSSKVVLETPWVIERESAPWTHRLLEVGNHQPLACTGIRGHSCTGVEESSSPTCPLSKGPSGLRSPSSLHWEEAEHSFLWSSAGSGLLLQSSETVGFELDHSSSGKAA